MIARYVEAISVKRYPSGETRIEHTPSREILMEAFEESGTLNGVAAAFGVARSTVQRWARLSGVSITSRPEAGLTSMMRRLLIDNLDKVRISQWLMDEGSVSVAYHAKGDYTILPVCGGMNDSEVLDLISKILATRITSSKAPGANTLPLRAVRVQSARAYALLEEILPHLRGLKRDEAQAALRFFPSSGLLRGRHTTDEFLLPAWKESALGTLRTRDSARRVKITEEEIVTRADSWVAARIRRARRFLDGAKTFTDHASS